MIMKPIRQLYQIDVEIYIKGPFLTKSSGALKHGLDASAWRYKGNVAIPGTLISGSIRHTLEYFCGIIEHTGIANDKYPLTRHLIQTWFGLSADSPQNTSETSGKRKSAIFDYAWTLSEPFTPSSRTRISINPDSGTVEKGSLIVSESALHTNQTGKFEGSIKLVATADEADCLKYWVTKAVAYIPAYGSMKSAGYGQSVRTTIADPKAIKSNTQAIQPIDNGDGYVIYSLAITVDRPFCIAPIRLPDTNRFETLDYVPGNVLKASMAEFIRSRFSTDIQTVLAECGFDHWHVSHACEKDTGTVPHSIAIFPLKKSLGSDVVVDSAYLTGAPMLCLDGVFHAPVYASDRKYKHTAIVKQSLNIKEPESNKILSLHTRIEDLTNTADDNGLFSQEEIQPEIADENGEYQKIRYFSRLMLPANHRHRAEEILQAMSREQLTGMGRTQACATIEWLSEVTESTHKNHFQCSSDSNEIVITLTSDAELFKDQDLNSLTESSSTDMTSIYQIYWERIFSGGLTMKNFFATQRRSGGKNHWRYYQNGKGTYAPVWLTESGSVFYFKAEKSLTESMLKKLREIAIFGLPPVGEEASSYDAPENKNTWKYSPYLRQHGYGQASISVSDAAMARAWLVSENAIEATNVTQLPACIVSGKTLEIVCVQGVDHE